MRGIRQERTGDQSATGAAGSKTDTHSLEKQLFRVKVLVPHSVGSRRSRLLSDQWSVMGGAYTEHEGPRNFESPAPIVGVLLPLGII